MKRKKEKMKNLSVKSQKAIDTAEEREKRMKAKERLQELKEKFEADIASGYFSKLPLEAYLERRREVELFERHYHVLTQKRKDVVMEQLSINIQTYED
jgi:hypothetical protein